MWLGGSRPAASRMRSSLVVKVVGIDMTDDENAAKSTDVSAVRTMRVGAKQ